MSNTGTGNQYRLLHLLEEIPLSRIAMIEAKLLVVSKNNVDSLVFARITFGSLVFQRIMFDSLVFARVTFGSLVFPIRVSDPYPFFPDPDPAFEAGDQSGSGSRALMTKN
jgi:hypothetical protein